MPVHHASIAVRTGGPVHLHDVTAEVRRAVRDSGVCAGIALLSVPHTTCAVAVNEHEEGLRADLERLARHVLDPLAREGPFAHDRIDDNARAHLTAVLLGHQTALPIRGGEPVLGTWQSVFLVELDGPRARTLHVQVLGE
jgi:secondary thiamine-phosphate synthase enzyme